jgi:hypothetical protein
MGIALLLLTLVLPLAACDGLGIIINAAAVYGTDRPAPGGDRPTDPTGPTPDPEATFSGVWITSLGDDRIGPEAGTGNNQYAIRIELRQAGTEITGAGIMIRSQRFGAFAIDNPPVDIRVSGSASGDDAAITISSVVGSDLPFPQEWILRLTGNRIVGVFASTTLSDSLVRSGHTIWYAAANASAADTWVAAFGDATAVASVGREVRTGVVSIARDELGDLTGSGSFIVQSTSASDRKAGTTQDFNVVRGNQTNGDVGFTFGALNLTNREIDWFGFVTDDVLAVAYAQFNADNALTQLGHSPWYRSSAVVPTNINHTWVTSFKDIVISDAALARGRRISDYLVNMTLTAQDGNVITGSGTIKDEGGYFDLDDSTFPDTSELRVENGVIIGSRIALDLVGPQVRMVWDLRLGSGILVGTYEMFNGVGQFISSGAAEWRISTTPNLVGTWAVAYFDTLNTVEPEITQLAIVTIATQDDEGFLSGVGSLRFADTGQRRTFNVLGEVTGIDGQWIWRGADLFGDTTWNIHQAGNVVVGTYTNDTSSGGVESKGHGLWLRANVNQP